MNKEQLTAHLKSLEKPLHAKIEGDNRRAPLLDNWEEIEKQNEHRQQEELQKIFKREACCFFTSDFWLYADDMEDATAVKKQLNEMGYTNLETFVPKVGHPDDNKKSIDDPDHALAIRVSSSNDLIFGDHAKKWLSFHEKFISVVSAHIIYTYCHNADACFVFNDKIVATLFHDNLTKFYSIMQREANKVNRTFNGVHIKLEDNTLDTWKVRLQLKAQ